MTHHAFVFLYLIQFWKCLFCVCVHFWALILPRCLCDLAWGGWAFAGTCCFSRLFICLHSGLPRVTLEPVASTFCKMKSIDNASPHSCLKFWWRVGGRGWKCYHEIKQVSSHLEDVLICGDAGHGVINLSHRSVLLHGNNLDRDGNAPSGQNRCVQDLCVLCETDICHLIYIYTFIYIYIYS